MTTGFKRSAQDNYDYLNGQRLNGLSKRNILSDRTNSREKPFNSINTFSAAKSSISAALKTAKAKSVARLKGNGRYRAFQSFVSSSNKQLSNHSGYSATENHNPMYNTDTNCNHQPAQIRHHSPEKKRKYSQVSKQPAEFNHNEIIKASVQNNQSQPVQVMKTNVEEYEDEIFEHLFAVDKSNMVNPLYMNSQERLDWSMRSILIDWLIQVHLRFNLLQETIFITVNMIDRFLEQKNVAIEKFQLLGVTCLFIACKYEEEHCPNVSDLVYMVDNCYTADEIIKAERFVLNQLHFKVSHSGPLNFVRRISKADNFDFKIRTLCKYFLEISLMDERFLVYSSAQIAAAGMYLSRRILYENDWTLEHARLSRYSEAELVNCAKLMLQVVEDPSKHKSIYEKYQDSKYLGASTFMKEYLAHINQIYGR